MDTFAEIQHVLRRLSADEREAVVRWLREVSEARDHGLRVEEARPIYTASLPPLMSVDEYLELEEKSQVRHEYINGVIYAMSGPTLAHVLIAGELHAALKNHLRGGPCKPFMAEAKLRIQSDADDIFYYPDVMVDCRRDDWGKYYVRNPKLVAEVLSPSTQNIDRREKAMSYRRIASVEEYVLIEQDEHRVTVMRRAESWRPQAYIGPQAVAELRSVGLSMPLAQLYEDAMSGSHAVA